MADKVASAFTVTIPGQDAALSASAIAASAHDIGIPATAIDSVEDALGHAINAARDGGGAIIIAGSLYLAGHILSLNGTLPD